MKSLRFRLGPMFMPASSEDVHDVRPAVAGAAPEATTLMAARTRL
jgi:hypothetical protein